MTRDVLKFRIFVSISRILEHDETDRVSDLLEREVPDVRDEITKMRRFRCEFHFQIREVESGCPSR